MEPEEIIVTVVENQDPEDLDLMLTYSFVTEEYDATEERISKSSSIHACKVCEDVFRNKPDLLEHIKNSYECRVKKIYRCVKCDEIFPNVGIFQLHLLTHSQENSEEPSERDEKEFSKYVCELCGKDFVNQHLKKIHIEHHFDQRGSVLCPTCGKCISSKEMYQRHQTMHGYKSLKRNQCQICNEDLKGARRLREHLRIHTGEKTFECNICAKIFTKKSVLRIHLKKNHFKAVTTSTDKTKTVKTKTRTNSK